MTSPGLIDSTVTPWWWCQAIFSQILAFLSLQSLNTLRVKILHFVVQLIDALKDECSLTKVIAGFPVIDE